MSKYAQENGRSLAKIGPDAESALLAYAWPGNVRELENTMERATVIAQPEATELTAALLPAKMRPAA